jgi:diguanylate cyclase (GGDEF)-like protein
MNLHEPTLIVLLGLASVISSAIFAALARITPTTRGPAYWALGSLLIGVAMLSVDQVADWRLSALLFNLPLTCAFVFQLAGTLLFCGWRDVRGVLAFGLAANILAVLVFTLVIPDARWRISILAAVATIVNLCSAIALWRQAPAFGAAVFRVAASARALEACACTAQGLLVLTAATKVSFGAPEVPWSSLIAWSSLFLNTLVCDPMLLILVALRLVGELREASEHDALTGLLNRRGMHAVLDKLTPAADHAATQEASVLLFDVDHFKAVNDRHGHDVGDQLLAVAGEVLGAVDTADVHAARWGGEEFCVVAPNMERRVAAELAERIRIRFHEASRRIPQLAPGVTISVGVAAGSANSTAGILSLVSAADAALYAAKQAGRNRVEMAA